MQKLLICSGTILLISLLGRATNVAASYRGFNEILDDQCVVAVSCQAYHNNLHNLPTQRPRSPYSLLMASVWSLRELQKTARPVCVRDGLQFFLAVE